MKILVLAGGADQIALINELKGRGHEVVLVDYFENPPARSYVDRHYCASTLDEDAVEKIAVKEEVGLICTVCTDQALLTVANVSERLGLSCYISYHTALNVTNKSFMKKVMVDNKIPTSKFVIVDKVDTNVVRDFVFPVIVKPVDCNSSNGVKRIDAIEELSKYLEEAILLSRTKTAIIEEYKEGKEISVDYYIEGNEAKMLSATSSLKMKNSNSFTILCSDFPAVDEKQKRNLKLLGNQVAKAFELKDCPLFIQMIVNGDEINVIEFSARMGGGSKYHLIQVLSGVNIMSKYVDLILGEKPSVNPICKVKFCKMVYIYCNPGVFDHVDGFDKLKKEGVIDDYFLYKTKGMEIKKAETSSDRIAGYLITGATKEELSQKLVKADDVIKIVSKSGNDIMKHNLL